MTAADPLLEVGRLGADRRGLAVPGEDDGLGRQRQERPRIDPTMVGKSLYERPVAPGPPRKRVSPLNTSPSVGKWKQHAPGE